MIKFILLILFMFVVFPLLKIGFAIWRQVHQMKKVYKQQYGDSSYSDSYNSQDYNQQYRQQSQRQTNANAGEYVEFEEIKEEREVRTSSNTDYYSDGKQQITDVEFEEIN